MSDPTSSAAAPARGRPSSVTISTYLLYFVAALLLISSIATMATTGRTVDVLRDAYAGTPAAGTENVILFSAIAGGVISILFAIGLAVLALLNSRGRNVSRIITWVLGALVLCCNGGSLIGTSALNSLSMQQPAGVPDAAEIDRRVSAVLPSWLGPLTMTMAVLVLLATLAAMILLALPASNEFFRRRGGAADPAMPGYPGYPGYPSYPAYPQTGAPPTGAPPAGPPSDGPPPAGPADPPFPPGAPPR